MTAEIDGDFVGFIIGMQINRWWNVWSWLPIVLAMPRMLKELAQHTELGCLGSERSLGLIIQCWRSFEHLEAYARNPEATHYPAWVRFNRRIASSRDVGIWNKTYPVAAGRYEVIYNNTPQRGLAKTGHVVPATGCNATAALRTHIRDDDQYPHDEAIGSLDDPSTTGS